MPQVTREMQIKATLRHYFAPVRMTIIEKSEKKKNVEEDVVRKGTLMHYW